MSGYSSSDAGILNDAVFYDDDFSDDEVGDYENSSVCVRVCVCAYMAVKSTVSCPTIIQKLRLELLNYRAANVFDAYARVNFYCHRCPGHMWLHNFVTSKVIHISGHIDLISAVRDRRPSKNK